MKITRYGFRTLWLELAMIAGVIVFIFPIYILLSVSFKSPSDVAKSVLAPPSSVYLDNFANAWNQAQIGSALLSSLIVTVTSVAILVFIGSLAAYAIVRSGRRFSTIAFMFFILGLAVPIQFGMVPLYGMMRDLGLLNNYISIIAFQIGVALPLTIFLYSGFIRTAKSYGRSNALIEGVLDG